VQQCTRPFLLLNFLGSRRRTLGRKSDDGKLRSISRGIMQGLNDSFFESSNDAPVTDATPATETKTAESAAAETTHEETKVDNNAATTTAEEDESKTGTVPKAALLDERKKRQEYERKVKELEEKYSQQNNQSSTQNKQEEKVPDFYENPDERFAFEQKKLEEKLLTERIRMSAALVSAEKPDYIEMTDAFKEAVASNPQLEFALYNSANPALFAYNEGKKYLQIRDVLKDPVGYRAKIESEVREKLLKEIESEVREKLLKEFEDKQSHKKTDDGENLTASLTGARSTGSDSKASKQSDESDDAFDGLFDPKTRRIKR
jgi:hypothetical protein